MQGGQRRLLVLARRQARGQNAAARHVQRDMDDNALLLEHFDRRLAQTAEERLRRREGDDLRFVTIHLDALSRPDRVGSFTHDEELALSRRRSVTAGIDADRRHLLDEFRERRLRGFGVTIVLGQAFVQLVDVLADLAILLLHGRLFDRSKTVRVLDHDLADGGGDRGHHVAGVAVTVPQSDRIHATGFVGLQPAADRAHAGRRVHLDLTVAPGGLIVAAAGDIAGDDDRMHDGDGRLKAVFGPLGFRGVCQIPKNLVAPFLPTHHDPLLGAGQIHERDGTRGQPAGTDFGL